MSSRLVDLAAGAEGDVRIKARFSANVEMEEGISGVYRPYDPDRIEASDTAAADALARVERESSASVAMDSAGSGTAGGLAGGIFVTSSGRSPRSGEINGKGEKHEREISSNSSSSSSDEEGKKAKSSKTKHKSKKKKRTSIPKFLKFPGSKKGQLKIDHGSMQGQSESNIETTSQSLKRPPSTEVEVQADLEFDEAQNKPYDNLASGAGTPDLEIFTGIGADHDNTPGGGKGAASLIESTKGPPPPTAASKGSSNPVDSPSAADLSSGAVTLPLLRRVTVKASSVPVHPRATITSVGSDDGTDVDIGLSAVPGRHTGGFDGDASIDIDTSDLLSQIQDTINDIETAQKEKLGVEATEFSADIDQPVIGYQTDFSLHAMDIHQVSDDLEDIPHSPLPEPKNGPILEVPEENQISFSHDGMSVNKPGVSLDLEQSVKTVEDPDISHQKDSSDDGSDIEAYLGSAAAKVNVSGDVSIDGNVSGTREAETSAKAKHKKRQMKFPKFKFGSKKVAQVDGPTPSVSLDQDHPETEVDRRSGDQFAIVDEDDTVPAFQVMGKGASVKRKIDPSSMEVPVSKELEFSVESAPKIDADLSLSTGDDKELHHLDLGVDGDIVDSTGMSLGGEVQPRSLDVTIEGDKDDSDIEAYLGGASVGVAVGAGAEGLDASLSRPYSKGKMSKKGKRKVPSLKSKSGKRKEVGVDVSGEVTNDGNGLNVSLDSPSIDARLSSESSLRSSGGRSLSEPNLVNGSETRQKGFTLPRLKMPRFKKGWKTSKDKRGSYSFDTENGGTLPAKGKRSSSLPDISYNAGKPDANNIDENKKKRWSAAFKLPSFGFAKFGGKSKSHSETDGGGLDLSAEVDVSVNRPDNDAKADFEINDRDDVFPEVATGSMAFKTVADIGNDTPDFEMDDVNHDVDANIGLHGDGSFGMDDGHRKGLEINTPDGKADIGKRGFDAPDIDVEYSMDADIDVSKEVDIDVPKEVDIGGASAPHVDVAVGAEWKLKGTKDGDTESVTSSSSSSSSESEKTKKKKKGLFGGLHFPKFKSKSGTHKAVGTGVSFDEPEEMEMDIDIEEPDRTVEFDKDGIEVGVDVVMPEISAGQKNTNPGAEVTIRGPNEDGLDLSGNFHLSGKVNGITGPNCNADASVGGKVDSDLPAGNLEVTIHGKPEIDFPGKPQGDIDLPDRGHDVEGDVDIPRGDLDLDVDGKGGVDIPGAAIGLKVKRDSVVSTTSSSSSESEKTKKKKKGLFASLHLPKFKGKSSSRKAVGTGVSFDDDAEMDVNVEVPEASLDLEKDKNDAGGNVVFPSISAEQKNLKPSLDVNIPTPDVDVPEISGDVQLPRGDLAVSGPEVYHPDINGKFDGDIDLPKGDLEIDVQGKPDVDLSGARGGGVDFPDSNMNIEGGVDIPSRDLDLDAGGGGGIGLPAVGLKMKKDKDSDSVTSTSSSSSSESEKTKKMKKKKGGLFGGLHLPKFKGKGSPKKAVGTGVSFDGDVDVEVPEASLDFENDAGGNVVLPSISADQKNLNPSLDVDISTPDVDVPEISGDVQLPRGDLAVSGPEIHHPDITDKIDGDIDLPEGDLEVDVQGKPDVDVSGALDGGVDLPDRDLNIEGGVDIPSRDLDLDAGGGGGIGLPAVAVGLKMKKDKDSDSVTSTSSSSSSESEKTKKMKKKKGGLFGGLHLPKFKGKGSPKKAVGTGVNFDGDVDVEVPEASLDFENDAGGNVVLPSISADQKNLNPSLDVNISTPDVDVPEISGDVQLPRGDLAVSGPEIYHPDVNGKIDGEIDLPKGDLEVDVQGKPDVDLSGALGGGVDFPDRDLNIEGGVDIPSRDLDLDAGGGGGIGLPAAVVGLKMKKDKDSDSVTSTSSSSSSESEKTKKMKKKKGGLFGGLHLPKFKGKGSPKKAVATGVSFDNDFGLDVDVEGPDASLDIDNGGNGIGGNVCRPDVTADQRNLDPSLDVNISSPDVDRPEIFGDTQLPGLDMTVHRPGISHPDVTGEIGGDIYLPKGDLEVDFQGKPDLDLTGKVEGDIDLPDRDLTIEGDVDIPRGDVDLDGKGCVGISGAAIGLKMKRDSVTSTSSSESEKTKKKKKGGLFGGIHLPKFKGKGSPKKTVGTGVSVDGHRLDVEVEQPEALLGLDKGGREIGGNVVLPDVSVEQKNVNPSLDVNISSPDVNIAEVSADVQLPKGDIKVSGPEIDHPNVSGEIGGDIDLPKGDMEVDIQGKPDVDLTGRVEGDIDLPDRDLNIEGDIGIPKGGVDLDVDGKGGVGIPGATIGLKMKRDSVTSTSSSESEKTKKKKKGGLFGGLHLPKFKGKGSPKKAVETGVSFDGDGELDVEVERPGASLGLDKGGREIGGNVLPDVSVDNRNLNPSLDVNISTPDVDVPEISGDIQLPKGDIKVKGPEIGPPDVTGEIDGDTDLSQGNLEVDIQGKPTIDFPSGNLEGDIDVPDRNLNIEGDLDIPRADVDLDVDGKGGVGIPGAAIGLKVKRDSVASTSSASSSESEKTKKKKKKGGLFGGLHFPKFKGKGPPHKAVGTGVSFEDDAELDLNVKGPDASLDKDGNEISGDIVIPAVSADQKNLNPSLDVNMSTPDFDITEISGDVQLPEGDLEVRGPEIEHPKVTGKIDGDIDMPKGHLEIDIQGKPDLDLSGKLEGDVDLPERDFNIEGDVEIPSGDLDLDVGGRNGIGLPGAAIGLKMKRDKDTESVTSSSSSSESEKIKKKKKGGLFGGLHFPKFKGKGPPHKAVSTGISFEDDAELDLNVKGPDASLDKDGNEISGDIVIPAVSADQRNLKPSLDVNMSTPDFDIAEISGDVQLPEGDLEVRGPEIEHPKITGKIDGDIDMPKGNLEVDIQGKPDLDLSGKLEGDVDLPERDFNIEGDVEIPSGDLDLDVGGRNSFGLPGAAIGLKMKRDKDAESVTSSSSSSSSESERIKKKKTGGLFGGLHFPKFKGKGPPHKAVGTGVSFDDGDDIGMEIDVEIPKGSLDLDKGEAYAVGDVVLPDVNEKNLNPEVDFKISVPDVDGPDISGGIQLPDGDIEMRSPGVGQLDVGGKVDGDIDVPKVNLEVHTHDKPELDFSGKLSGDIDSLDRGVNIEGDIPRGQIDTRVEGGIGLPGAAAIGLNIKRDKDTESVTSTSSSSSSESEKAKRKKKGGLFGGFHLPKFKGKDSPKKADGADVNFGGDLGMDADVDIGGGLVLPDQKDIKPDLDVSVPDVDADISGNVQYPKGEWEVSGPDGEFDINVAPYGLAKPDVTYPKRTGRVKTDVNPPSADVGFAGKGDIDLDVEGKGDVDIDVKVDIPDKGRTLSSTSSEGDSKPKKGLFGGVHMPKLKGKGKGKSGSFGSSSPEVDFKVDAELNPKLQDVSPDLDLNVKAPSKAPRGILIDSPEMNSKLKVDPDVSDVEITIGGAHDHDFPKVGGKVDVDVDIDTPEFKESFKVPDDKKIDIDGGFAVANFPERTEPDIDGRVGDVDFDVEGSLEAPKLLVVARKGDDSDRKSTTSSSSSSDDEDTKKENEKKKKKGFSLHLPKIGWKNPKWKPKQKYAGNVEVELNNDVDIPDQDVGGAVTTGPDTWDIAFDFEPSVEVEEPEIPGPQVEELDFAACTVRPEKPELNLDILEASHQADVEAGIDVDLSVRGSIELQAPKESDNEGEITFENFGRLLAGAAYLDDDDDDYDEDTNIDHRAGLQAEAPVAPVDRRIDLDTFDWGQLGLDADVDLKRSSSKSSVSSSERGNRSKNGTLPKFGKGEGEDLEVDTKGNASVKVEVDVPSKEAKSPKGKRGLFKRGKDKKRGSPKSPRDGADIGVKVTAPDGSVSIEGTPQRPESGLVRPASAISPPGTLDLSGAIAAHSTPTTPQAPAPAPPQSFSVVVAIDLGTIFSGYAYSFSEDPSDIRVMKKWEGGDPGAINRKTLTTLVLTPEGEFHSFGFTARDFYNDMNHKEAQKWLYFDKYKLVLHENENLNMDTTIAATNGTEVRALEVFEHTLKFFKDLFLKELDERDEEVAGEEIRWVITVPAIWTQPAKQFMRRAAYKAGIASPSRPGQLLMALEPEAASIYIGRLNEKQLMPESSAVQRERWLRGSLRKPNQNKKIVEEMSQGSRYVIVDCGGGTSDVTVHEVEQNTGTLKELHKASGGTFGSGNIDEAFIKLIVEIFGKEFIDEFKLMRPAGWVDLMLAFEARKRNANPWKANYLNVALPFSFVDYYKKFTNDNVSLAQALADYGSHEVKLCSTHPPMIGFSPKGMARLFDPTTNQLMAKLEDVLAKPELGGISHIFMAGGFADSPLLQNKIRKKYNNSMRIVIPKEAGLATLKGAVMYGHDPSTVTVRRARLTYGVGALNRFNPDIHPKEKEIVKDGISWCRDIFDVFVHVDQPVPAGEIVTRSYAPASMDQEAIKINIYCSENDEARFITDEHVQKCGTLIIDLGGSKSKRKTAKRRELQLSMQFGDTEMKVNALDVSTGVKVDANVDFLNN